MIRSTLSSLSLPLSLVLAGCVGGTPMVTDSATDSDSESSSSTTDVTTTTPTMTTTVDPSTTDPSVTEPTTVMPTTVTPTTDTTVGTTETTGSTPDCDAADGEPDDACDPATPFCVAGECVDCGGANGDSSCETLDGANPVCAEGACVECSADNAAACSGASPVCDEASNECAPCTEHSQCGDTACNFAEGSCFSSDYVLWVDKAAEDCMVGDGTMDFPFCTLAEAFLKIEEPDNLPATWTVRVNAGIYIAAEHITPAGSSIVLIADNGNVTLRSTLDGAAGLTTGDASTLYLQGITLTLAQTSGLKCSASTVYATDTRFSSNTQHGVEALDCDTFHNRSLISQNSKGGVASYGAGITYLENSFVTANGSLVSEFGGVRSAQGNELEIVYSTLIGNDGDLAASIQCVDANGGKVRNSVVIGRTNNPSVDCMDAMVSYSLVDGGDMQGENNMIAMGSDVKTWFEDPVGDVFRARAVVDDLPSPIAEVAQWIADDPIWDYDGDPRPATEGSGDFPGADVPAG